MSDPFGSELSPEYLEYRQAAVSLEAHGFVEWLLSQCAKTKLGCLIWRDRRDPFVTYRGENLRVTYLIARLQLSRPLAKKEFVRRSCQNMSCINPRHIFVSDASRKVTMQQAQEIVALLAAGGCFKADIARQYGISVTAVNKQPERLQRFLASGGQIEVDSGDEDF